MKPRIVVMIPARYGSSRLPGKPLADLGGKPMIQHVYEHARASAGVTDVLVATDDVRIAEAVRAFQGRVVMTSSTHVSGTDRLAEVAEQLDDDIVVNVQGDLPLFAPDMITAAVAPLLRDTSVQMATLKTPIWDDTEWRNPNVVKVVTDRVGNALYFSRSPLPFWRSSHDGPLGYRHIGMYVYRRELLLRFAQLPTTALERAEQLEQLRALEWGIPIRVAEVVNTGGIEVDTPADLERARHLLT